MENTTLLGQAIWGQRPEEGSWTVPVRWFVPGTGVARDDNLALFPISETLVPCFSGTTNVPERLLTLIFRRREAPLRWVGRRSFAVVRKPHPLLR